MSNKSRREAYQFYRSIGYSVAEASKMRNRSPARLAKEYRRAAREYNRPKQEDFKPGIKLEPRRRPNRPDLDFTQTRADQIGDHLANLGLRSGFIDQVITDDNDLIDLEVYNDRFTAFNEFFKSNEKTPDFQHILDMLYDIEDLGELLDILGEMYSEAKGE
jgi:hypothetical protein